MYTVDQTYNASNQISFSGLIIIMGKQDPGMEPEV